MFLLWTISLVGYVASCFGFSLQLQTEFIELVSNVCKESFSFIDSDIKNS
jgi:hypothetical protein